MTVPVGLSGSVLCVASMVQVPSSCFAKPDVTVTIKRHSDEHIPTVCSGKWSSKGPFSTSMLVSQSVNLLFLVPGWRNFGSPHDPAPPGKSIRSTLSRLHAFQGSTRM